MRKPRRKTTVPQMKIMNNCKVFIEMELGLGLPLTEQIIVSSNRRTFIDDSIG